VGLQRGRLKGLKTFYAEWHVEYVDQTGLPYDGLRTFITIYEKLKGEREQVFTIYDGAKERTYIKKLPDMVVVDVLMGSRIYTEEEIETVVNNYLMEKFPKESYMVLGIEQLPTKEKVIPR